MWTCRSPKRIWLGSVTPMPRAPPVTRAVSVASEIQAYVKARLAAHEYPREVAFVEALPMTATGKIMRRELRRRESRC